MKWTGEGEYLGDKRMTYLSGVSPLDLACALETALTKKS